MKNIHVLPTDKPTRLFITDGKLFNYHKPQQGDGVKIINQNIYITSDEEIKEGDWCYHPLLKGGCIIQSKFDNPNSTMKKIILTTDQDLIKDGVQAIDDEFLEWFVKNPSCEWVEVEDVYKKFLYGDKRSVSNFRNKYKIIIPKEEPKQETLEEAASRCAIQENRSSLYELGMKYFQLGAKWQAERMYSEEDMWEAYKASNTIFEDEIALRQEFDEWFEQFKKKISYEKYNF